MKAGVLQGTWPGETRVAVVPGVVPVLARAGVDVVLERGAGDAAGFPTRSTPRRGPPWPRGTRCWRKPSFSSRSGRCRGARTRRAISPSAASGRRRLPRPPPAARGVKPLAARGVTSFALELVPRISRAQGMDALSSTATMVGYKAVLLAASALPA